MPPELIESGEVSTACDVYAFGILMWECYTAVAVYKGLMPPQVVMGVASSQLRPSFASTTPQSYQVRVFALIRRNLIRRNLIRWWRWVCGVVIRNTALVVTQNVSESSTRWSQTVSGRHARHASEVSSHRVSGASCHLRDVRTATCSCMR